MQCQFCLLPHGSCLLLAWVAIALGSPSKAPAEDANGLNVLPAASIETAPSRMMYNYLRRQAHIALAQRRERFAEVKTPGQIAQWQQTQREFFIQQLGGLPPRTPLNAKVVGKLEGDRFRGEKILFESQPNVFVSAIIYLPTETKPPYPAVLIPCGHNASGKAGQQQAMILLARNGIAALSYDPVGQGERYLILDDEGNRVHSSVDEHTLLGVASIPVGRNAATYRAWDGLRAVDYLASRKDIDAKRLGVTGCSGGGTMTSYLMALDERLKAAAPSCYITSFDRLIDTIGPQDAEQNIHGQIAFGMDHADYIHMRAPRPTLILASTHDFFDIDGVWQTFREAKQLYTRMGVPHRVSAIEADQRHGFPAEHRVAMTNWMLRWLANNDAEVNEPEVEVFPNEQVLCTPRGQVMLLPNARSAFDLNVDEDERLAPQRAALWKNDRTEALAHVRQLAGIRPVADLPQRDVQHVGEIKREGYRIEKLILHPEDGIRLPALAFVPEKLKGNALLYLHGDGKQADAGEGGPIEQLVKEGHLVLAVDLRGLGETQRTGGGNLGRLFGDWQTNLLAYLLAQPIVGMRTEDTLVAARFLQSYRTDKPRAAVSVVGIGEAGPAVLHAAALEPELFSHVTLRRSLISWANLVRTPDSRHQLVNVVPGALRKYDLPDLVAAIGSERIHIEEPVDARGELID